MRKTFTAQAGRIPRHGFTLVEILGAILIISILAALMTVGGRAAMRFFRGVNDKATIDNIAKALELYKNKYGEYPPDGTDMAAVRKHLLKRDPSLTKPANIGKVDGLMNKLTDLAQEGQLLTYWLCGENWVFDALDGEGNVRIDENGNPFAEGGESEFIDLNPGFYSLSEIGTAHNGVNYNIAARTLCNAKGYPVVYFKANKTAKDGVRRWYYIPNSGDWDNAENYESIEYENGETFYNEIMAAGDGVVPFTGETLDPANVAFYFNSLAEGRVVKMGLHPYRHSADHAGDLWYAPDSYQLILPGEDGYYVPNPDDPTTLKAELDNVTNFCAGATMAEEEFEGKHLESGE